MVEILFSGKRDVHLANKENKYITCATNLSITEIHMGINDTLHTFREKRLNYYIISFTCIPENVKMILKRELFIVLRYEGYGI
jgi:hypothetical protein